jgi:hypothetical protein
MFRNCHGRRIFATVVPVCTGLLCLCIFVMVFGRGSAEAAEGSFVGTSGFRPRFAIADFDGDLKPDLATVQIEQDAVVGTRYSIRLQLSAGEESAIGITGPLGGLQLVPRDVNGDDAIDLIVTTASDSHFVAVLINDGHGKFTQARAGDFPGIEKNEDVRLSAARGQVEDCNALQVTRSTFGIEGLIKCGASPERNTSLLLVGLHRVNLADFRQGKSGRSPPVAVFRS